MGKVEYIGNIKSFNVHKGWGFIECPETQQIYGKDILFQKSELPSEVEKGDRLSFSVTQGRNGVLAVGLHLLDKAVIRDCQDWKAPSKVGLGTGNFNGVIKSYNPQKGWGFVESQEAQEIYGKDILFLKEELRGAPGAPGQHVAFSVSQGRKGPLATSLQLIPAGTGSGATRTGPPVDDGMLQARPAPGIKRKWQDMQDSWSPSFLGTIKSFNLARGWGFVECEETQQIYGKDILVLKDEVAGVSVSVGQRVSFRVTQGRNGPLATDIQIMVPAGGPHLRARPSMGAAARAPQATPMSSTHAPELLGGRGRLPAPMRPPDPQEHICGIIKSFDEQKGWGFITGEAILHLYGKDIYLSKNELRGQAVSPGDQVMFVVEMGMKGPMASGVAVLPGGSFVVEGSTGMVFTGLVKSFNAEKGWGFVTSEESMQIFGKDLFLHKRELGDGAHPNAGDQVQFTVQLSTGGRPEAANVSPLSQ